MEIYRFQLIFDVGFEFLQILSREQRQSSFYDRIGITLTDKDKPSISAIG